MKKILKFIWIISLFSIFITSCDSGNDDIDEPEIEYPLEISLDKNSYSISSLDTTFTIVDGNGGYIVNSSDSTIAKVSIKEEKTVYVSFISNGTVTIEIKDAKEKSKKISMSAYDESLVPTSYGVFLPIDSISSIEIFFGAGDYHIENIKGESADISIKGHQFLAKGLIPGNTYFDIIDKRGTVCKGYVMVPAIYELVSNTLSIDMIPDQIASIRDLYGCGNWKLESYPQSLVEVYLMDGSETSPHSTIQINSLPDVVGNGIVQLKDKEGNIALINVSVNNR